MAQSRKPQTSTRKKQTRKNSPGKRTGASRNGTRTATFQRNKRGNGWIVRVVGPHSDAFSYKTIPVTMKDDSTKQVELTNVIWSGYTDDDEEISLYGIVYAPPPRAPKSANRTRNAQRATREEELEDEIPF